MVRWEFGKIEVWIGKLGLDYEIYYFIGIEKL